MASSGQHCLVFYHTRLIQEALECESLKSQDLARALEREEGKKHGNVQQQKTMTDCFQGRGKKKISSKEYIICIYFFLCGTLMHIQSIYTGLHHRNLEHRGCTFKSMHCPTMRVVVKKKRKGCV